MLQRSSRSFFSQSQHHCWNLSQTHTTSTIMYQSLIRNLKVYPSMELDRAQLHTKSLFPGRVTHLGERKTNLGERKTSRFWAIQFFQLASCSSSSVSISKIHKDQQLDVEQLSWMIGSNSCSNVQTKPGLCGGSAAQESRWPPCYVVRPQSSQGGPCRGVGAGRAPLLAGGGAASSEGEAAAGRSHPCRG